MDTKAERIKALEVRTDYQQDSINKLLRIQEELTKSDNELVISSKNQTESIKEISMICKETTDKMNDKTNELSQKVSVLEEKQNHIASELFINIFSKLNWKNVGVSIIIILLVMGQIFGWNVKDTINEIKEVTQIKSVEGSE